MNQILEALGITVLILYGVGRALEALEEHGPTSRVIVAFLVSPIHLIASVIREILRAARREG